MTDTHQILCLEQEETKLYGEVIQVITKRHLYWVRPLVLCHFQPHEAGTFELEPSAITLYDLRQGADLLCPQSLFRVALDIEMIPILTQLEHAKAKTATLSAEKLSEAQSVAHRQLQAFIRQVWQAHPEAFRQ